IDLGVQIRPDCLEPCEAVGLCSILLAILRQDRVAQHGGQEPSCQAGLPSPQPRLLPHTLEGPTLVSDIGSYEVTGPRETKQPRRAPFQRLRSGHFLEEPWLRLLCDPRPKPYGFRSLVCAGLPNTR